MAQENVDWPLAARSQIIVAGTIGQIDRSSGKQAEHRPELRTFKIKEPVYLKDLVGSLSMRNVQGGPILIISNGVAELPKTRAIFFLSEVGLDPNTGGILYELTKEEGSSSILPYAEQTLLQTLRTIIGNYKAVEAASPRETTESPYSDSNQSAKLVKEFLMRISAISADKESQKTDVEELVSTMGVRALFYLIYYMDDLRPFSAGSLTVELKDDNGKLREVTFHPKKMVDAIDILLLRVEQLLELEDDLRVRRRFLTENPSIAARRNAVKAWQIHWGRLRMASEIVD
jgi:hypothetical protein